VLSSLPYRYTSTRTILPAMADLLRFMTALSTSLPSQSAKSMNTRQNHGRRRDAKSNFPYPSILLRSTSVSKTYTRLSSSITLERLSDIRLVFTARTKQGVNMFIVKFGSGQYGSPTHIRQRSRRVSHPQSSSYSHLPGRDVDGCDGTFGNRFISHATNSMKFQIP